MANGWVGGAPLLRVPTAQALPADLAATADSEKVAPGTSGVCTAVHERPFQCSSPLTPSTAQALLVDVTATLVSPSDAAGFAALGVDTRAHRRPFQCRARVCDWPPFEVLPTAHAFDAELAATAN